MRTTIHLISVFAIATLLGGFGLWYLSDGQAAYPNFLRVMCASCAIWVPLSLLYRSTETAWILAPYFGLLSPFIGCLITAPPWSFLIVISQPMFSITLGLLTSAFVCAVSRCFAWTMPAGVWYDYDLG